MLACSLPVQHLKVVQYFTLLAKRYGEQTLFVKFEQSVVYRIISLLTYVSPSISNVESSARLGLALQPTKSS